ncbi:Snf7-domain-containing protein [Exidia glandulosa HHB12029]|uniref:Vacuolar-sorting protein SNF7 n=1 Tax=Exidia glandulosa HHB12029 TaxID=1314781 RepID=A0A166BSQ7_EXIGL|nr:Snf7-domain-containing protein [Exidia glandulosa HHB12029]
MSGWMGYFTGRRDPKATAREAIVTLRTQLQMLEKKEENLQRKIDEELKKAKTNAVSNKAVATAALRRKKAYETELDKLAGTRLTLETQVNTIESANLNAETMAAMKRGADALKVIHGTLTIDKVDATMEAINAQRELANEISDAISNPINSGTEIDEDELKAELAELESEQLDRILEGADRVPVHSPGGKVQEDAHRQQDLDEEAELKELQAALAM